MNQTRHGKVRKMLHVLELALILATLATGCSNISSSTKGEESSDDIIITPGGPAYRANVQQEGVVNRWPPIQARNVILDQNVHITYRANMDTKAGQTRNNILYLRSSGQAINTLDLKTIDVPDGMDVKDGLIWHGPLGAMAQTIAVEISRDIKAGQYTFEISIFLNGTDCGQIPCTITVT